MGDVRRSKAFDLSQDFSMHTPAFASYTGPSIKWVKRLAFDKAGGQIDEVLDQKVWFGCFPWRFQGGEAAFCRAVAWLD